VHLSAERLVQLAHAPGKDTRAYDLWLQGQAMLLSFDARTWDAAAQLFRDAIAHDPTFAPAYSSLAQQLNAGHIALPGTLRNEQRTGQALAYARDAARFDPIDSRSQLCLGWSNAMAKHYDTAEIYLKLAHELNENDPWTLISAANCLAFCGAIAPARALADYVLGLPLAPSPLQWAYHTAIRFLAGDYAGCVAAAERAGDANPNVPGFKAAALAQMGEKTAATQEMQRLFSVARRRWVGEEPASDATITRWFLHLFPIRKPEDWSRLRDGLAAAGAPVGAIAHHAW
jgi:tetratricopeptide (TPR) repeat protein